jgi:NitT/TauT family transport system substrate-binding protein
MVMNGTRFSRRSFLSGSTALAGGLAAGGLLGFSGLANAAGKTAVTLQTGGLLSSLQIGEVVAKQLGYFDAEGIDFTLQAGGPNNDGVTTVASGRAAVGQVSSSPSLMLAVSQQIPIKCFAIGGQEHTYGYFSLAKNPVRTPHDLIGKTVGTQGTGQILLKAMLAKNNINPDDVKVFIMSWDMTPILTGQVDVVTASVANVSQLKPLGEDRVFMRLWDTGVKLYTNPYYATLDNIANNRPLLEAFLRAASKGWGYAYDNPAKAVDLLIKEYPTMVHDDELAAMAAVKPYMYNANTKQKGWGTMDPAIWQSQIEMWSSLKQFARQAPKVEDCLTLDILNATADSRAKIG